jgi:hypothetical protein
MMSGLITFRNSQRHCVLAELGQFLRDGHFADARIVCRDGAVRSCHRLVLASASPVLRDVLLTTSDDAFEADGLTNSPSRYGRSHSRSPSFHLLRVRGGFLDGDSLQPWLDHLQVRGERQLVVTKLEFVNSEKIRIPSDLLASILPVPSPSSFYSC